MKTRHIILVVLGLGTGALVWGTFYPSAPVAEYLLFLAGGGGLYGAKRLLQKQEQFNGKPTVMEGESGVTGE